MSVNNAPTLAQAIHNGLDTSPSTMLIFGDSGTGKTSLAAMLSNHYKLLWFDLEQGVDTLVAPFLKDKINLDNIQYQPIFDTAKAPLAWSVCKDLFEGMDVSLCYKHGKQRCTMCETDKDTNFGTYNLHKIPKDTIVVFDSGSQIDVSVRSHVYGTAQGAWKANQKATYDQWNQIRGIWDIIGTKIQASGLVPVKIVAIFHEDEAKDGSSSFPALGTRAYANTFGKYFSTIVHTHSRNLKYGWDINAIDSKAVAKNRAGIDKIDKLEDIIKLWE